MGNKDRLWILLILMSIVWFVLADSTFTEFMTIIARIVGFLFLIAAGYFWAGAMADG